MMRGLLWPNGRLTSISESTEPREGAQLVDVVEVPSERCYMTYDPVTKRAVPHSALIAQKEAERAARDPATKVVALEARIAEIEKFLPPAK